MPAVAVRAVKKVKLRYYNIITGRLSLKFVRLERKREFSTKIHR